MIMQLLPILDIDQIPDLTSIKPSQIPSPPAKLAKGESEEYVLDMSLAAKLGFSMGDVGATARHQVLVHGTIRYADVFDDDGHMFRFGWALRAVIVATSEDLDAALTLPVLAAKVQMGRAEASGRLHVLGYTGNYETPTWASFDVKSYNTYQTQVDALEKQIATDPANISPQLLQVSVTNIVPGEAASVAVVYALSAITHKHSLQSALSEYPSEEDLARDIITQIYRARVGAEMRTRPDDAAAKAAHDALYGMSLGRHFWDR